MMISLGSPFFPLTYMNPSAPAPPDLLITIQGVGQSLYFEMRGEMNRAIWSAPPPDPAGTTNSTGLLGCQAFAEPRVKKQNIKEQKTTTNPSFLMHKNLFPMTLPPFSLNRINYRNVDINII